MVPTNHKLILIIEDDVLFYPDFVTQCIAGTPIPIVGIIIAKPALKHNRYVHALKTIRHFRITELIKLVGLYAHYAWKRNSLFAVAHRHAIPTMVANGSVNTSEVLTWVEALAPTIVFSASPLILGKKLLGMVPLSINMHFSLLPAYKGIMPLFHAMAAGEATSGISLHAMIERVDEGRILYQRPVDLCYDQPLIANYRNFFNLAPQCVISLLADIQQGVENNPRPSGKVPSYFRHPDAAAWKQFRTRNVPFI